MDAFRQTIKAVLQEVSKQAVVDPEKRVEQLLAKPRMRRFQREHPEMEKGAYLRSLNRLDQYIREWDHCDRCPGLENCPNLVRGHRPFLVPYAGYIDLRLSPCPLQRQMEEKKRRTNKIRSHYIPNDVLNVTFEKLELDATREEAIFAAMAFAAEYRPGEKRKGLYLYGDFGVGKSCIAGAMAQELAMRDISVYMVYVPEFFRELKESIQEGSSHQKVEELKRVSVLILDDIGAEGVSPWLRDEVLGSILQYRVSHNLPTVYTSNFTYDELEEHLAYSQKNGFEAVKAGRIMERIRHETEAYHVGGPNRRTAER